jgi:8-oxo-dGTP diphosphatase
MGDGAAAGDGAEDPRKETMTTQRDVACAVLIDTLGRFLLQQRDDIPGILHPGTVGFFGGHREDGESYLECVVREIKEEIGYSVPAERFEYLTDFTEPNVDGHGGSLYGKFFVARDIPTDGLIITEGSLLTVRREGVGAIEPKFSPTTRFVMNYFLNK